MKWRTLLAGQMRKTAEETLREIAAELGDLSTSVSAGEAANLALFYGYLAEAFQQYGQEEVYAECAFTYLNDAISRAPNELRQPYLCGGYAGLGWVIANLTGKLLEPTEDANCEAVDQAIIEFLQSHAEPLRYELLYGLAGLGVYALERLPHPAAVEILRLIIARLSALAERVPAGVTWFTSPESLPEWRRLRYPNGYYNLGLAHGAPGVLPMLARACAVEQTRAQAWELLEGAGQWLRAQQLRDQEGTSFPHWLAPEIEPRPGRLAWCYGSLGAATAWLDAARRAGQPVWEAEALAMLRRAALTAVADSGVRDAGLCHGAAGAAHIFNRLYQATGEEIFERAALRWYEHALSLRQPGTGLAGYRMWAPSESGAEGWETRPDFLDGVAGVGLALLAACAEYEPQWDRLLAVSLS
ncbi:MAG TPA: lanthionine synthetase C family protein [Blastocatellia bacterium]|nr:lanthionine synthetase C family protein [Blastocatellia bacterium]